MELKRFDYQDVLQLERLKRMNLINSLSGFKSANLVGTHDRDGHTNLAIFSSALHFGANPPLQGILVRPTSVPRHTYANIKATGEFTLNHVNADMYQQAHQTAARYADESSEFEAVGLSPLYGPTIKAPYVLESHIRIGLRLKQEIPIPLNGTILLIGEVHEIMFPADILAEDGFLDLEAAGTVAVSNLDSYHKTHKLERLPYART